jgi:hypothetical protein
LAAASVFPAIGLGTALERDGVLFGLEDRWIWSPNFRICSCESVPTPCAQPGSRPLLQSSVYMLMTPRFAAMAYCRKSMPGKLR